ncbi:PKD domain-containing protein [Thermanaerothrix daxensis]|uniref:PKD domain-containing protein n=1 Tax=Thermanaerothrix daxensis TaxID=869279 RepID=UPI00128FB768|nr:hypothetical protein [Thermanaerothrix daxensis]
MDYDIAYSDQHSAFTPVVCLGPDRVLKLTGSSVSTQLDASASWVIGSTISSYSWSVIRGPATLSNANTATPTLTATAPGRILIGCTVTASNGKSSTGYRNVYVYSDTSPAVEVVLESFHGSFDRGGFEFSIRLPSAVDLYENNKVILFSEDQPQSIGPIVGAENIVAVGWVDLSECEVDDKTGTAILSVKGTHHWLSNLMGFPVGLENVSNTPTRWTEMQSLTVDKALWHLFVWRSTVTNCVDVFLSGDTRQASVLQDASGDLWKQIKTMAEESILASPMCDPYGRVFVQIDTNYILESNRGSIPIVMTLSKDDCTHVQVDFYETPKVSRVDLSGVAGSKPIVSSAPGSVFGRTGKVLTKERLLFSDQEQANHLASLIYNRENRKYDFTIELVSANRLITLVPNQYLSVSIADETPRKITYSGKIVPRGLSIEHDPNKGVLRMSVVGEPEVFKNLSQTIQTPLEPPKSNIPLQPDLFPVFPLLPVLPGGGSYFPFPIPSTIPSEPPMTAVPGTPCRDGTDASANGPYQALSKVVLQIPGWDRVRSYYKFFARPSNADNPTMYMINGRWLTRSSPAAAWVETQDDDFYTVYLLNATGQRIATGIKNPVTNPYQRTGYFNNSSGVDCWGIEIELNDPVLSFDAIYFEYLGHPWSNYNPATFNYGSSPNYGYYWASVEGTWNTGFYSWHGFRVNMYKGGANFYNWPVNVRVVVETQLNGQLEPNPVSPRGIQALVGNTIIAHKDGNTTGDKLSATASVAYPNISNTMQFTGQTWIGYFGLEPVTNFRIKTTWQVWLEGTKRIEIDSVFLWNICQHIDYIT